MSEALRMKIWKFLPKKLESIATAEKYWNFDMEATAVS